MSAQLLPEIPTGTVAVEIAWGADLTDTDGSGWSWTDITSDVRAADGLTFSLGRSDEASVSQPANLALKLDNTSGDYSLGGRSSNWPNVRRGTPVRVRVDIGSGAVTAWQGYADGFTPTWDSPAGQVPVVAVSASGVLRRLSQGTDPLRSALYRYLTLVEAPAEYWPLEEEKTASQGESATGGSSASFVPILDSGVLYGKVKWGGDDDNPATSRAVTTSAGGSISCPTRSALFGTYWAVSWSMRYTSGSGARLQFDTTLQDDTARVTALFYTSGDVEFYEGASFTPVMTWNQGDYADWDDVWHHYLLVINGFSWSVYVDGVLKDTHTAVSAAPPETLKFSSLPDPGGVEDPISVAHVAVFSSAPTVADLADAAAAHRGELATDRLVRLCAQQSVDLSVSGTTPTTMGPQTPATFLDLLRECETADQGVLYDGVGPGLRYVCRSARENAAVDLTVDADELVAPFAPTDDDQRTRNRVTAQAAGSKATVEDVDGPLGTAVVGVYDSSLDVNIADSADAVHYAGWAVHAGTQEGYRFPALTLDLRAVPARAAAVLALEPSSRVLLQNVADTVAAMPDEDVNLLVEGVSMTLAPYAWRVTLKCSPFGPWIVGTLADDSGDTDDDLIRLDTDGSTLSASASVGSTSISVATTSGPLWTTTADDYPLLLDVGGVKVRATACVDGTSPQVMTVDALPVARSSGAPVKVWAPPALAL